MCDSASPTAASASSATQASLMQKVQMSVARKALDVEQSQGDAAVQLIQAAAGIAGRVDQANAQADPTKTLDLFA